MKVLGIDPGTATTGFGVIKTGKQNKTFHYISSGIIKTKKETKKENRLKKIFQSVLKLIKKFNPSLIAIEKVYFYKNTKTAINVSESKGVILLAAAINKKKVIQITPLEVKTLITGYGRAKKKQMQKMINHLLKINKKFKSDDEVDALAIAVSGCIKNQFKKTLDNN